MNRSSSWRRRVVATVFVLAVAVRPGIGSSAPAPPFVFPPGPCPEQWPPWPVSSLASTEEYAGRVAVDATSVYWVQWGAVPDLGSIMRVPRGGGAPSAVIAPRRDASAPERDSDIAVDATSVYWTTRVGVMKAPKAGGAPVTVLQSDSTDKRIAVDSSFVYALTAGTIVKVPLGGGPVAQLAVGGVQVSGIALDASRIYWGRRGTSWADLWHPSVVAVPLAGATPTALASWSTDPVADIAVDGASVYFSTYDASGIGGVFKVALSGGEPTAVATGQKHPRSLVVDATSLYWTVDVPGDPRCAPGFAILRAARRGGPVTELAPQNCANRVGLASAEDRLYWTCEAGSHSWMQGRSRPTSSWVT